jgi:protein-disulfide isomerase
MIDLGRSLDQLVKVAVIVACGAVSWNVLTGPGGAAPRNGPAVGPSRLTETVPREPIALAGSQMQGKADARVVVLEFSDFQCPYCGKFEQTTLPELRRQYIDPGTVLFAFRNLPLESLHPLARGAAEAAVCAGEQGNFWPMHDLQFSRQRELGKDSIATYAKELGLSSGTFQACLTGRARALIDADVKLARSLGISSTPTFLIGTRDGQGRLRATARINGAAGIERFDSEIKRLSGEAGQPK